MVIRAHWEETEETAGRPREPRRKLLLEAQGALPSGAATQILVHDISTTGVLLESATPLALDEKLSIELPEAGVCWARVVWNSGKLFGCQFHTPIRPAALSAAELRSAVDQSVDIVPRRAAAPDGSFGARLQRLRKLRGISQSHVAAQLGVSKPTVWAWEHGKARPVDERIAALADVLGVTGDELLADDALSAGDDLVLRSRAQIAAAFGVSADKVKIWVEL
jgi:transcriptional regulator with XRE-family HTH domain